MPDFRSYPPLEAFERLQTRDGLAINAERWRQAHQYHRRRHTFLYQALYQPGILYGLGVSLVPNQPDGRLVQVQPGIAIDLEGNPIVIQQPEEFRISSEPEAGQTLLVYLVISYVDPDQLRHPPNQDIVQETFRIVEKLQLDPQDVEICRIQLQAGVNTLTLPENVFFPGLNQLDFRGRCDPLPYPSWWVKVSQVIQEQEENAVTLGWIGLLQSLEGLYPSLGAVPTVQTIPLQALNPRLGLDCQLLHLPYRLWQQLPNPALDCLQTYLASGGVVLLAADFAEVGLIELLEIAQDLRSGLNEAKRDPELFQQVGYQLEQEMIANQNAITQVLKAVEQSIRNRATQLGLSLAEPGELGAVHPLRCAPFLFSQWPRCPEQPIFLKNWGGLVLMIGDLVTCWAYNPHQESSREVLRSAQEWGVNLLHFAAQRWRWMQAMQPQVEQAGPTDTLQRRTQFTA